MSERLAYAGYDALGLVLAALAVPAAPLLWYRGLTAGACQRLGRVPAPAQGFAQRPIWLHAASVGETLSAVPLVEALRRSCDLPLIVSNTTLTGRAVARRELLPEVSTLLPIDPLRIVDRVFRRFRPRVLVIVETEIWPGLLRAARRSGTAIVVVSGRMSEQSLRRYQWASSLIRVALREIDAFCMQSEADADRVRRLGALPERVFVTGSLKAVRAANKECQKQVGFGGRPYLVAASTHPGEEALVLAACLSIWEQGVECVLVLAPRRPERFPEVVRMLEDSGLRFQRRSGRDADVAADTKVLLVDTLGELASFFGGATGVFVGGSIAEVGGHNVLEPAMAGVAVSFGPNLANVRAEADALMTAGGGLRIGSATELAAHWSKLITDPSAAEATGKRAAAVAEDRANALPRTLEHVLPLVEDGS